MFTNGSWTMNVPWTVHEPFMFFFCYTWTVHERCKVFRWIRTVHVPFMNRSWTVHEPFMHSEKIHGRFVYCFWNTNDLWKSDMGEFMNGSWSWAYELKYCTVQHSTFKLNVSNWWLFGLVAIQASSSAD